MVCNDRCPSRQLQESEQLRTFRPRQAESGVTYGPLEALGAQKKAAADCIDYAELSGARINSNRVNHRLWR